MRIATRTRHKIARLCVIVSFICIGIGAGVLISGGHADIHAISVIACGSVSVFCGTVYLRSSGRRS